MIVDYLHGGIDAVILKLYIIFLMWVIVLAAIAIDLYFGIRKSKEVGEFKTHSWGLRQTIKKITYYLAVMAFMFMLDCINPLGLIAEVLNILPWLSTIGAIVLVWTEFISVREKAEEKYVKRTTNVANELMKLAVESPEIMDKLKEKITQ